MNWLQQSLNRKFAVGTAAGLLVSSLFFLILFVNLYRGQLERERAGAAGQVSRLLQTSLENVMLKRDVDGLRDIVNRLGEEPGILDVRIANPAGEVRFASNAGSLGTWITPEPHEKDQPTTRLLEDAEGRSVLRSVNPIHNRPQCGECHGAISEKPVNGILYVDFDAAPILEKARATTLLLMGSGALIVLINLAGGWWFIRRYVIRPVEHLSDVSLRLSQGDLDARTRLGGQDEFSALAHRFNRMAEHLKGKLAELEDKEVFLQGLVDAIPDGIRVIDEDYRVVLSNVTYRRQHGFAPDRPVPELCYSATHGRDSPCPEALTLCTLKEVNATEKPLRVVHRHQSPDGEELDVEIYAAPMRVVHGGVPRRMVVESIRDLEQQVRFSHEQRLSELGRLAAGVAHEIHNPLAAVRMALHAAEDALQSDADPAQVSEYLTLVDQEVVKCNEVTERLLKLSMPPSSQTELVALDQVVGETLKLLVWETDHRGVRLELDVEEPPLRVLASDSDLRMMTLNLAQNAVHAMPGGGVLSVRCRREEGHVAVLFQDTGVGIDPRVQPHIFEPFFSRRADGQRGTGLGLSITKAIVEGHGGTIRVESNPSPGAGQGTRFTVIFPDADKETED